MCWARAAIVHLNFWAGSTFPPAVCTVPSSIDRTSWCNKVDAVRLYASYRLNLLLLKMQRYVTGKDTVVFSSLKASKSNHSYKFFVDTFVDKPQLKIICFLNYKYCYLFFAYESCISIFVWRITRSYAYSPRKNYFL